MSINLGILNIFFKCIFYFKKIFRHRFTLNQFVRFIIKGTKWHKENIFFRASNYSFLNFLLNSSVITKNKNACVCLASYPGNRAFWKWVSSAFSFRNPTSIFEIFFLFFSFFHPSPFLIWLSHKL